MATSNVIYLGELRTQATHLSSNSNIVTDAPIDNQGKGEAFSPTDLMATSLASCMLTILGIYCKNNSINMTDSNAEITKIMSAKLPRRIVEIKLELNLIIDLEIDEKLKTILDRVARTCPVSLSLHPEINQNITINIKSK